MRLAQSVRNKIRAFLQAYGTPKVKGYLWDTEFSGGRWDNLDATPEDCVYPYVEKSANGGSILDLGCGSGSTANELDTDTYRDYTGVDISGAAISKARSRTEQNGRAVKNRFFRSDIASYVPTQRFDVILFRDSIYYIPRAEIKATLDRYSKYLKPCGVFVARMWDGSGKHKAIAEMIESNFNIVGKSFSEHPNAVVLVFRHRPSHPEIE